MISLSNSIYGFLKENVLLENGFLVAKTLVPNASSLFKQVSPPIFIVKRKHLHFLIAPS